MALQNRIAIRLVGTLTDWTGYWQFGIDPVNNVQGRWLLWCQMSLTGDKRTVIECPTQGDAVHVLDMIQEVAESEALTCDLRQTQADWIKGTAEQADLVGVDTSITKQQAEEMGLRSLTDAATTRLTPDSKGFVLPDESHVGQPIAPHAPAKSHPYEGLTRKRKP